jgi:DNA repair exonuclease SbcCD nuclease subunit
MSFVGVCVGDLHLDKLTKYWPDANKMQLRSARLAVDAARRKGATEVFFLGDIAEGIRDNTGNAMRLSEPAQCAFLAMLLDLDQHVNTHVILGNHDWASEGSHSLQMFLTMQEHNVFRRVRFYADLERVKIGTTRCAMMPFPHTAPPAKTELAFAHYEVGGAVGDNGRSVHASDEHRYECHVIQGHLHTHQRVRNHWYPGTLYQTSFGENEDKGYAIFQPGGKKLGYEWIQHKPPFILRNLRVNEKADFKQLVADEKILFKLFVHESVKVPDDLLTRFPNIVNRLAFASEAEAEVLERDEFQTENQKINLDTRSALPDFLVGKGASKKQVERALQIVDDFSAK